MQWKTVKGTRVPRPWYPIPDQQAVSGGISQDIGNLSVISTIKVPGRLGK